MDNHKRKSLCILMLIGLFVCFAFVTSRPASAARGVKQTQPTKPVADQDKWRAPNESSQSRFDRAQAGSAGCITCHASEDGREPIEDIHGGKVSMGCVDCHGGNPSVRRNGEAPETAGYDKVKESAHAVKPNFPDVWKHDGKPTARNPERVVAAWTKENIDYIKFVNPGDLRVAAFTCGTSGCHGADVHNVGKSMMTTGTMLWNAALYNNGTIPFKIPHYGESFTSNGTPQRIYTEPKPTNEQTISKGILPFIEPLPRWETSQMGNILRTFERGGRKAAEIGNPGLEEAPGKPTQNLLSPRGLGTLLTTDPTFLGLQKTRLLGPMLSLLGTNDESGDYRSSGCSACHVVYANDRDPFHSGPFAKYGNGGTSASVDATMHRIPNEPGHPIRHQFTRAIPSSQCVVCHMHPGTNVVNTFYGTTWWDLETDGEPMYPKEEKHLSAEQKRAISERNPEQSAFKGNWGDREFLKKIYKGDGNSPAINDELKKTQFADFNGHGWVFRDVFKQDRQGNYLDVNGNVVPQVNAENLKKAVESSDPQPGVPVHLKDIHLEKGMHCVDCHFKQDNHGNGNLYGEVRNAIEIDCADCHGTVNKNADPTSADAKTTAAAGGNPMLKYRYVEPEGALPGQKFDRFYKKDGKLFQRSALELNKSWEVIQVRDSVTPGNAHYNEKAALAKTILTDNKTWGNPDAPADKLAHDNNKMTCFTCHLSWTPSCFGCHLKMEANQKRPMLHNEGEQDFRNYVSYNFQTLRDDVFMLGRDGTATRNRIAPVRSACAVLVSSQNALREWLYFQQQTVSAEGYSGQAFSSHFPHTVRTKETKGCTDCHVSKDGDNNAYMAMTLMQGTNFYNFIGRYAYAGLEKGGFEAVVVTERDEPQTVIGSYMHKLAYPAEFKKHEEDHKELKEAYEHPGYDISVKLKFGEKPEINSLQLRGEYLYAATGKGGLQVYDVANIDQKGFSERITTAPFSPFGQKFYVKTRYATAVASPSTLAVDPTRKHYPENGEANNRDDGQAIPALYAFLYVTDREEGLIMVNAATLLDGDPNNNFLKRAPIKQPDGRVGDAWNPNGILTGASNIVTAGNYAYITTPQGLVVVGLEKVNVSLSGPPPASDLRVVSVINGLKNPKSVAIQFRYAFVTDDEGLKVVDITNPEAPTLVNGAFVPLANGQAHSVYIARTYAYVAAGTQGLAIIDVEHPTSPKLYMTYNADGRFKNIRDVKLGMTYVSLFAYLGDERGMHVVQLTSPETPGHLGFSPVPKPEWIATRETEEPVLAISEGIDRDRAIDESGNQLSVFGRRGARPFNGDELKKMYITNGAFFTVPSIRDSSAKNRNEDIRRAYGNPQMENQNTIAGPGLMILVSLFLPLSFILHRRRRNSLPE